MILLGASQRRWTLGLAACVVAAAVAVGVIAGLGGFESAKIAQDRPPPTCENGATADAASDSPLVEECELQLELLETLDSGDKLNWSATTDISEWEGVTVAGEGEEQRVTKLALSDKGLTGELPERLVDLEELTELRVDGNSLTGRIPSVLGNLRHLTHVYVSDNSFTGCYPPSWDDVANSDLDKLSIPSCAIPYDLRTSQAAATAGSYTYLSDPANLASAAASHRGKEFGLLINQTDTNGDSQATFYDTIAAGDVFHRSRGERCFARFVVTEVLPDPVGDPPRALFKAKMDSFASSGCVGQWLYNEIQPVLFIWHPVTWAWSEDDIRVMDGHPVTGPGRYRLHEDSSLVITIPDNATIELAGVGCDHGCFSQLTDVATRASLHFNEDLGIEAGRRIHAWLTAEEKERVNALFDAIAASIERLSQDD